MRKLPPATVSQHSLKGLLQMRFIAYAFFLFLFIPAAAPGLHAQKITVYDQLTEVNKEWKKVTDADPWLNTTAAMPLTEKQLIQQHLREVEKLLRKRTMAHLTGAQKQQRLTHLNTLHGYWQNGVFPVNTFHTERRPYFIDVFNTYCAVGYLMKESGADAMARDIHCTQNYSYLRDITHPALAGWVAASGLSVSELALIQPGYGCYPTNIVEIHYDNAGADANEYIEILQSADIFASAMLNKVEFYDHNNVLYKTLPATAMSYILVWAGYMSSYRLYYYQFAPGDPLADSGTIRLRYDQGGGITGDISVFQYNSSGVTVTQPIDMGPGGGPRHYTTIEDGTGAIGTTLNLCGYCTWASRNAMLMPATTGAANISCLPILPLTLAYFDYSIVSKKVQLRWRTFSESNTDRFELERSIDGGNFSSIGTVTAAGNSSSPKDYTYLDASPQAINYYRLRQVDQDGKASYSQTLQVKLKDDNQLSVYSTLVSSELQVRVNMRQQTAMLNIVDGAGRTVLKIPAVNGANKINVSALSRGYYFIQLQTGDGTSAAERFVKQ